MHAAPVPTADRSAGGVVRAQLLELVSLLEAGRLAELEARARELTVLQPDAGGPWKALGVSLQLQRKDAMAALERAAQMLPEDAEAHANLGTALIGAGRHAEAIASFTRALQFRAHDADAHSNLGNALRAAGRFEAALASYQAAARARPGHAELHGNLGQMLLYLGRPQEALSSLERALELAPDCAEAHSTFGNALLDLGRAAEASAAYRRALELKPEFADALSNLAIALRLQGFAEEAMRHARRSLELNPISGATRVVLADAHADRGEFEQAERVLREAVAIEPDSPEAWAGIAHLRPMSAADTPWLEQARRIAAKEDLAPRLQAQLRYALGKYFDDLKDYGEAFAQYRRANEVSRRYRVPYDRPQAEAAIDALIRSRDRQWLQRARTRAVQSRRPIFILGMPRSGTSLAEQILAAHPAVLGAGELSFWGAAAARLASKAANASEDLVVRGFSDDYLRLLQDMSIDAPRVVDKMPENFLHLGLIHAALPEARIIHMRRNPVDTCLSIYFQDFKASLAYATDLGDLAHYYRQYWRLMDHWRSILPDGAMLEVSYESMVSTPESWIRKLVDFVGVPWDARCLEFQAARRTVVTASKWQVRQKISGASVARWRHYQTHLQELLPLLELTDEATATAQ